MICELHHRSIPCARSVIAEHHQEQHVAEGEAGRVVILIEEVEWRHGSGRDFNERVDPVPCARSVRGGLGNGTDAGFVAIRSRRPPAARDPL